MTQFARSIGATVGVTIMGVIVNQGLPHGAAGGAEAIGIHRLPPALREALAEALHPAFFAAAVVSALVFVVVLVGIKDVPLREAVEEGVVAEELAAGAPDTGGAEATGGSTRVAAR
jgi:hypothetical protein